MEAWKSSLSSHKVSNLFMIAGFTIAFLALFLGLSLYSGSTQQDEQIAGYEYESRSAISIGLVDVVRENMEALINQSEVNVDVFEYMIYLDDFRASKDCEISLRRAEPSAYPLMEGSWTYRGEEKEPTVVVGKAYESYFVKKDGKSYLRINHCEYLVTGILSGENGVMDYAVILNYDTLPEEEKECFWNQRDCRIRFGSNMESVLPTADAYYTFCEENDLFCQSVDVRDSVTYNNTDSENITFYVLIYLFALGICIISSELWIYERKMEIIICKTYGWGHEEIVERYYKEFLRVLSIGVVLSLVLQGFITLLGEGYVTVTPYYIVVAACMIIISSIVSFLIPMVKVYCYMPEELLTKESGLV